MKKTFRPATLFVSLMIMGSTLGLTSCSDDDDVVDNPIEVTTKTMYGDYEGKMTTMASTLSKSEELVGVNVKANVDNDTVCIKNFPIKDVVMSIVGDEAVADDIVALVGDIDYKIGYKPALSSAKDFILMVMEPEPLKINLKMPTQEGEEAQTMAIEVKVTASDNAEYGVEESKLKFDITATEVMLGEGEEQVALPGFNPTTFSFELNQNKVNHLNF